MRKLIYLIAFIGLVLSSTSCGYERIDAGHVGIKVNLYGDDKGVDAVTEVTGAVWYNPFTTKIFETPTFVQNAIWTSNVMEGSKNNEEFVLTTKDGMEVKLDVSLNYFVDRSKAVPIFKKYRVPLNEVASTVLRNYTRKGYNKAAASYTAEEIYANRLAFEKEAEGYVRAILELEGFSVEQLTLVNSIRLPKAIQVSIEKKVQAKQIALTKESELQQTAADANKLIEKARGVAESMKINADAQAYAYQQKQRSLSPLLVQQQWIEKWNGNLGTGNVFGVGTIPYKNISK